MIRVADETLLGLLEDGARRTAELTPEWVSSAHPLWQPDDIKHLWVIFRESVASRDRINAGPAAGDSGLTAPGHPTARATARATQILTQRAGYAFTSLLRGPQHSPASRVH